MGDRSGPWGGERERLDTETCPAELSGCTPRCPGTLVQVINAMAPRPAGQPRDRTTCPIFLVTSQMVYVQHTAVSGELVNRLNTPPPQVSVCIGALRVTVPQVCASQLDSQDCDTKGDQAIKTILSEMQVLSPLRGRLLAWSRQGGCDVLVRPVVQQQ